MKTVAIVGDGVAGAALACLLRARSFDVVMTRSTRPTAPAIEALPESTVRMIAGCGLLGELLGAGGMTVRGFDDGWSSPARRLPGWWLHVDRARLAEACVVAAERRGVRFAADADEGEWAVVDATGRAAARSRPIVRAELRAAALMFSLPGVRSAMPGRVVGTRQGWAYLIAHPSMTTVGVVGGSEAEAVEALQVRGTDMVPAGTRPASAQWARTCVAGTRISVGDAALAHDPRSGQGLRFAFASAVAAATVLAGRRDGSGDIADAYYRTFVAAATRRHLAGLGPRRVMAPIALPDIAHFTAPLTCTGVARDGRVVSEDCVVLRDGGLTRWVGGHDLLDLRRAIGDGVPIAELRARLAAHAGAESAELFLHWSVRNGVIA